MTFEDRDMRDLHPDPVLPAIHPGVAAGRWRSADLEDLLQRYGGHLHALAFHLSGDTAEAARLAREALVRHCLDPDPARDRSESPIRLYLGLIDLWRNARHPRPRRWRGVRSSWGAWFPRGARPLGALQRGAAHRGGPAPAAGEQPAAPGPLHGALLDLDPDRRVVLVLRVAEGLDYEEIAAILEIPAEAVRARLQAARARVQARLARARCPRSLERAMNLYLDGRLGGQDRAEIERHAREDAAVRESVEFHRGLTLEFAEEAPPPPRDFADRVILEWERRVAAGDLEPSDASVARPGPSRRVYGALAILAGGLIVGLGVYLGARAPASPPPVAGGSEGGPGGAAGPDEETIGALRSLGYLAGGSKPSEEPGATATARPPAPAPKTAPAPRTATTPGTAATPGTAITLGTAATPGTASAPPHSGPPTSQPSALRSAAPVPAAPAPAASRPAPSRTDAAAGVAERPTGESPVAEGRAAKAPAAGALDTEEPAGTSPVAGTGAAAGASPVTEAPPAGPPATEAPAADVPAAGAQPTGADAPAAGTEAPAAGSPSSGGAAAAVPGAPIPFRVADAPRGPELGRDHRVLRSARDWDEFVAAAPAVAAAPDLDYAREMIVIVRSLLQSDPPSRLVVRSVTVAGGALLIDCRVERGEDGAAPASPGQAIVLPASDLPIRVTVQ